MKIAGKDYHPRFLTPEERQRLDSWLRAIVRGKLELQFESEMSAALESPGVLRQLLLLITDCTPEEARQEITEDNAKAWAATISRFFVVKPVVFTGTAAEQAAALEAHLHAVKP